MTVQELIAELQKLPADLPVFVDGYEYGVHTGRVERSRVILNYRGEPDTPDGRKGYGGTHERWQEWHDEGGDDVTDKQIVDAVIITRMAP